MKFTSKLLTAVTGTVVATAIGLGAMGMGSTASAAAPTATTPPAATVQQKCDREPAITARYQKAHTRMETRLAHLQARHDKAVAAGHTKVAKRLERVITRLQQVEHRIEVRYDKYEAWVASNCPTA